MNMQVKSDFILFTGILFCSTRKRSFRGFFTQNKILLFTLTLALKSLESLPIFLWLQKVNQTGNLNRTENCVVVRKPLLRDWELYDMGVLIYSLVIMALMVVLWKISAVAKYWIKFLVFGLVSLFSACGPIPVMLLRPRDSRNALMPAAGLRACTRFLGLTYTVEGREHIVKDSGCVVLINHQSMLDLIVLAHLWPIMDNCTVISKKEIFYIQPFGLASWLWGTIFIDRVNAKGAKDAVNKTGETIRNRKARVLMFPEGTRNLGNKLLPFKKGAFHLALASQCPIQPVVVTRYTFLGDQRFDDGHIKIKILPPISTKDYSTEDLPKLMEVAYDVMSKNVDLVSKSTESDTSNGHLKTN